MTTFAAELTLRLNLRSLVPYSSRYYIHPEDKIYLDREDDKLWKRAYEVTRTFEEYVHVQQPDKDAQYRLYHLLAVSGSDDAAVVKNISISAYNNFIYTIQPQCRVYRTEYLFFNNVKTQKSKQSHD